MRKVFLIIGLIGNWVTHSFAQDVHFSQIAYSPLTLNPALAGANSTIQTIINYRTQWKAVASPYKTMGVSFDARLNAKKRKSAGHLVAGINVFNDQAGDVKVNTTNANLTLGYHLILDPTSKLGIAIYGGLGQRSINSNAGRWGSQYNGMAYDPTAMSGEAFATDRFTYADVGAGLVYTYKNGERYSTANDGKQLNYGFAVYHLNKPNFSFYNNEEEKLYMRFSTFINAAIGIGNSRVTIMPGVYYQRQKKAQELLIGTYFKYRITEASKITGFNKGSSFSIGCFYRNKDAFVVKGMLEWSDFSVGAAYDVNISSLSTVSNARGGFELFLRYNLLEPKNFIR